MRPYKCPIHEAASAYPGVDTNSRASDRREGRCLRCGAIWTSSAVGRPRKWCSQTCRRAAYEERRAAANGAVAIQVVERSATTEHNLDECVKRALDSPTACRHILRALLKQERLEQLDREPRWDAVRTQALHLARALLQSEQARQHRRW